VDYFPYHDDGTPKPRIALVPVINSSQSNSPVCLSEGLTQNLSEVLMGRGGCYVLSEDGLGPEWNDMISSTDLLNQELPPVFCLKNVDFVVVLELFEHCLEPVEKNIHSFPFTPSWNTMLMTKMRVKVIDVRWTPPRLILHEIVCGEYKVPKKYSRPVETLSEDDVRDLHSPFFKAHDPMIADLAERIDTVIRSAR
jgi:hypothetical protein